MSSHSSSRAELALPVWLPVETVSEEDGVGEKAMGGGLMAKELMESLLARCMISSSSSVLFPGVSDRYCSGEGLTPSYGADQWRHALQGNKMHQI